MRTKTKTAKAAKKIRTIAPKTYAVIGAPIKKCFACEVPGMQGTAHEPTCRKGAAETMKRVAALLTDLEAYVVGPCDNENCGHKACEESMIGFSYETDDPHDLHDLILNLAVLAAKQAVRLGVK